MGEEDSAMDKMKHEAKEMKGRAPGDRSEESEGKTERLKRDAKNAKKAVEDMRDKDDDAMESIRRDDNN